MSHPLIDNRRLGILRFMRLVTVVTRSVPDRTSLIVGLGPSLDRSETHPGNLSHRWDTPSLQETTRCLVCKTCVHTDPHRSFSVTCVQTGPSERVGTHDVGYLTLFKVYGKGSVEEEGNGTGIQDGPRGRDECGDRVLDFSGSAVRSSRTRSLDSRPGDPVTQS